MKNLAAFIFVLLILTPFVARSFMFTVDETEQAVVIQFGKPLKLIVGDYSDQEIERLNDFVKEYNQTVDQPVEISQGAGLYFKVPFVQNVRYFEDRLLEYDAAPTAVVTQDKKNLVIDNFARWKIINPLLFLQSVRTEGGAQARLEDIIYSVLRGQLAKNKLIEIVRNTNRPLTTIEGDELVVEKILTGREEIMNAVTEKCRKIALQYGIYIVDVRIKRADLPPENAKAVFGRMDAERNRISTRYRSEGQAESEKIKAQTDRDVKVILANAYKDAQTVKGDADGKAAAIYANAYNKYKEFYSFLKSLETLEKTINSDTTLVIGMQENVYQMIQR